MPAVPAPAATSVVSRAMLRFFGAGSVSGLEPVWRSPWAPVRAQAQAQPLVEGGGPHLQVVDNLLHTRQGGGITGCGLALGIVLHGTGKTWCVAAAR